MDGRTDGPMAVNTFYRVVRPQLTKSLGLSRVRRHFQKSQADRQMMEGRTDG